MNTYKDTTDEGKKILTITFAEIAGVAARK